MSTATLVDGTQLAPQQLGTGFGTLGHFFDHGMGGGVSVILIFVNNFHYHGIISYLVKWVFPIGNRINGHGGPGDCDWLLGRCSGSLQSYRLKREAKENEKWIYCIQLGQLYLSPPPSKNTVPYCTRHWYLKVITAGLWIRILLPFPFLIRRKKLKKKTHRTNTDSDPHRKNTWIRVRHSPGDKPPKNRTLSYQS